MILRPLRELLLYWLCLMCLVTSGLSTAHAAPAPAGSVISNTASGSFAEAASGLSVGLVSNTVTTTVALLENLTLTADQSIIVSGGSAFVLSHVLTNTGNARTTYVLNFNPQPGSGFVPTNLQLVVDANGNGVADPGEAVLQNGALLTLNPGERVGLLITGQVPSSARPGQSTQISLTATSQLQGATALNLDTLALTVPATVQVTLAASSNTSTPNSTLTLSGAAVNSGNTVAGPSAITIDGQPALQFVLRIPIPVNTTFVSAQSAAGAVSQILYHLAGTGPNAYVSVVPAGAVVDVVAWGASALPVGGRLQVQFDITVNSNASGTLSNTAFADWVQSQASVTTTSNEVLIALPARAPKISFYTGGDFSKIATQSQIGSPLFVQVDAASCNTDIAKQGTVQVTLSSLLTGDIETYTAVETAPNSGFFRITPNVPTTNARNTVVAKGNGVIELLRNDTVRASISTCSGGNAVASTSLLIDPSGVVYDSRSNQPVAGVAVTLIDTTGAGNGGKAGGPAVVFGPDGSTPAPSTVLTDAEGIFEFPFVPASTYRLGIDKLVGYAFPSKLPPSQQPAGRLIDMAGSYGGTFAVVNTAVRLDVPVDTAASGPLFIEKTANKITAEVGDFVNYTVKVNNATGLALSNAVIRDSLPTGFAFVRGTALLDGAALADPTVSAGSALQFALGRLAVAQQPVLTYRVRLGAGSLGSSGINSAQAVANGISSNVSSVRVKVDAGVFSSKAYLIGKVFADCNRNAVQDTNEPGLPGVRLYIEDGTYAVTDEEGKYSLYGLSPRTHVVKVDTTTLPPNAQLMVMANRNAMDAGSRFADLSNGELQKADFAVSGCEPSLRENIEARRAALRNPSEITQAATTLLTATPSNATTDARSLPSSGSLGLPGSLINTAPANSPAAAKAAAPVTGLTSSESDIIPDPEPTEENAILGAVADTGGPVAAMSGRTPAISQTSTGNGPSGLAQAAPTPGALAPLPTISPLESLVAGLTPEPGFIGLRDGQVLPADQTMVRVKGPINTTLELSVEGVVVSVKQVGKKSSLDSKGVLAWEYIGVNLKPGSNTLAVRAIDPQGVVRGQAQIVVLAPGDLARIVLQVPDRPVADAASAVAVTVLLRDAQGLPVAARTMVNLKASLGQWQTVDKDVLQQDLQVFIEGGEGRFYLMPPALAGKADLEVSSGVIKASESFEFVPNLRPLIAAGLIEGTINLRNLNASALQPAQNNDVFERQIQSVSRNFSNGKGNVAARAALFLKGKVLGSSLLTLAYDSDKPSDTALFRDIQPNQFYPVYGDSSARGFDAQSTGKLYVLLQNGTNYALLGDYSTQTDNAARQLSQYSRPLNGVKGKFQQGAVTVEGFASRTSAVQVIKEFRANGTSGPFPLDINGVVNSQQVNIITRNRNQLSVIVKDTPLTQFTDYQIEPSSGQLLLKSPVPSVDADLNPVLIRVTYSVDSGGPKYAVVGADVKVDITPDIAAGASVMRDSNPLNQQTLIGLNAQAKLGEKTTASAELVGSRTDLQGTGSGQRLEIKHENNDFKARVWGVHTDANFYNPNSLQSAGQSEYGAKASLAIDENNRLVAEALRTSNSISGAQQTGLELKLEHSLGDNARVEVGVRYSNANAYALLSAPPLPGDTQPVVPTAAALAAAPARSNYTSARVKLTVPVPGVPEAEVFGLVEAAIDGSGGREIGVGGNYALNPQTNVYVRHDFINSLNSDFNLTPSVSRYNTVAGINTDLGQSTQLFNEYRLGGGLDGRSGEAAVGVRSNWRLSNGLGVTGSFQRIKPIAGVVLDDSSALTLGIDYIAAQDWKASAQIQRQTSTSSNSWLLTGAVANKLDADWTLLNRLLYNRQTNTGVGGGQRQLITAQSGVALRPADSNVWNALARVQYKKDQDSTLGLGLNRDEQAWVMSANFNVEPGKYWTASARYAAKWARDQSNGITSRSLTQLAGGRVAWDLSEQWDVGLQAYRLWGDGAAENALGVEVGYLAMKNLWLSLGYNVKGFRAADLAGDAYTQRGLYVKMRYKFDETVFGANDQLTPLRVPVAGAQ